MPNLIDRTGDRYGRLTVITQAGHVTYGKQRLVTWLCQCDCGEYRDVAAMSLSNGNTRSCGCLQKERAAEVGRLTSTHGMQGTPEWNSWVGMRQRCLNPNATGYENYGGRGITICSEWDDFRQFYADMGPRPEGTSIDRTDVNGNYEPGNCRWATRSEQASNRR